MGKSNGKTPELLLPAGSPETLQTAIRYGADAVYLAGEGFGLRARAVNFDTKELAEAITLAHAKGVRVYVTANIYAREKDLDAAKTYFTTLKDLQPDALLIADPGMFLIAREVCPELPVHLSTQANTTNAAAFRFWYEQGVKRIVAARELSLAELAEIHGNIPEDMEIECFVHGAMCMSYSGRCFLSSMMTGCSANEGACKHPCRYGYALMEEKRPGVYFPVEEDAHGSYILHPDDLCMIAYLKEFRAAGIGSFKIEGRMKNALYVAKTARAYRLAIDALDMSDAAYEAVLPECLRDVEQVKSREYTTGFYFGTPELHAERGNAAEERAVFLGVAEPEPENGLTVITQRNKFSVGDTIYVMKKEKDIAVEIKAMYDAEKNAIDSCPHPRQKILMELNGIAEAGDVLFKIPD